MKKIPLLSIALLALSLSLLAACRSAPTPSGAVTVNKAMNGEMVEVPVDQLLLVQLESNMTTGYSWAVLECDLAVLKPLGDPEYVESQPGKQLAGSGGWVVFRFQPQAEGQTVLKLGYRRPWETDVAPVETFEIDVVVQ